MSWNNYFDGFGDAFGLGAQQQNQYWGGPNHQMAAAYNNQYNSQGLSGINSCWQGLPSPAVKAEPRKADCEGCGAPLKAHVHHCEYCRRAAC